MKTTHSEKAAADSPPADHKLRVFSNPASANILRMPDPGLQAAEKIRFIEGAAADFTRGKNTP